MSTDIEATHGESKSLRRRLIVSLAAIIAVSGAWLVLSPGGAGAGQVSKPCDESVQKCETTTTTEETTTTVEETTTTVEETTTTIEETTTTVPTSVLGATTVPPTTVAPASVLGVTTDRVVVVDAAPIEFTG